MVDVLSVQVKVVPLEEHWKRVSFTSPATTLTPRSTGTLNTDVWKSRKSDKSKSPRSFEENSAEDRKQALHGSNRQRRVKLMEKKRSDLQRARAPHTGHKARDQDDPRDSNRSLRKRRSCETRQNREQRTQDHTPQDSRKSKSKPSTDKGEKLTCHWEHNAKRTTASEPSEKQPISEASPLKPPTFPPDSSVFRKRRIITSADPNATNISTDSLSVNRYFEGAAEAPKDVVKGPQAPTPKPETKVSIRSVPEEQKSIDSVREMMKKPVARTPSKNTATRTPSKISVARTPSKNTAEGKDAKPKDTITPPITLLSSESHVLESKNSTEQSVVRQLAANKSVIEPRKYEVPPEVKGNLHRFYNQKKRTSEAWAELRYWFVLGAFMTILALYRNHLQISTEGGTCGLTATA